MTTRTLAKIARDLKTALRTETDNVVKIGRLLIEAKAKVKHGQWSPWLRENFGPTERTAQKYMAAAEFTTKYKTELGSDLKLQPSGLYALCELDDAMAAKVIKAAKKETGWFDRDRVVVKAHLMRVREAASSGDFEARLKASEIRLQAQEAEAQKDRLEAENILDGPPPELPPTGAPPPLPRDAARFETLAMAVAAILSLRTLPAEKLAESKVSTDDLESAAVLLTQIVEVMRRRQAA